jgi:hypothetical protein
LCLEKRKLSVVIVEECTTTAIVRATAARGDGRPKGRGELLALLTVETQTIVLNSFPDGLISLIHPSS